MVVFRSLLRAKLIAIALAASAVLAAVGDYIAPLFYSAAAEQWGNNAAVLLGVGVAAAASFFVLFLIALFFESSKSALPGK
jgi:uncharacterized membrane protein